MPLVPPKPPMVVPKPPRPALPLRAALTGAAAGSTLWVRRDGDGLHPIAAYPTYTQLARIAVPAGSYAVFVQLYLQLWHGARTVPTASGSGPSPVGAMAAFSLLVGARTVLAETWIPPTMSQIRNPGMTWLDGGVERCLLEAGLVVAAGEEVGVDVSLLPNDAADLALAQPPQLNANVASVVLVPAAAVAEATLA